MKIPRFGHHFSQFFIAVVIFVVLAVFFLFGLLKSNGDIAQADWAVPLTSTAAINDFNKLQFSWNYQGFGGPNVGSWGFPYFSLLNAVFSPLGFFGGMEIKILSVVLVSLAGITAFVLSRSLELDFLSALITGLFFMTTAVVFDWLLFGWIFFLIAYSLLPLMILTTIKFMSTNDYRYLLISGLIMSAALAQPAFILIYPLTCLLVVLFESALIRQRLYRGLLCLLGSIMIWFLSTLRLFTMFGRPGVFTIYNESSLDAIKAAFSNLNLLYNSIRFWGNTWNQQFEIYFPIELVIFSFIPIVVALLVLIKRPRDRRILLFSTLFLLVFVSTWASINLSYLVHNVPFGSVFEMPCVFLVPACLGIAVLLGYLTKEAMVFSLPKTQGLMKRVIHYIPLLAILTVIIIAGLPWWTGQANGTPIHGPSTKLNLYDVPAGYTDWSKAVNASDDYFVLYMPLSANPRIVGTDYFSGPYEGVSASIFTNTNNLPYVQAPMASQLVSDLMNGSSVGQRWGSLSIKYIVVYTNVHGNFSTQSILGSLSKQQGLIPILNTTDVVVYKNDYAKPVVYTNVSKVLTQIIAHDPTSYTINATSSSQFILTFNQNYSPDWTATVNDQSLPESLHFKDSNGFNSWVVPVTGTMSIKLYYEPQIAFSAATWFSVILIVAIIVYVVIVTVLKRLHRDSTGC
jgi:hypothetical protein